MFIFCNFQKLASRLLSKKGVLSDRTCVLRLLDASGFGAFADKNVWCKFIKLRYMKGRFLFLKVVMIVIV